MGLSVFVKMWGYISASKVFWNIVRNWYWIKSARDQVEIIFQEIQKTKSLPTQPQIKILIGLTREALEKGLIDLPNVNEENLAFELHKIEVNLISQVQKAPKVESN